MCWKPTKTKKPTLQFMTAIPDWYAVIAVEGDGGDGGGVGSKLNSQCNGAIAKAWVVWN